MSLLNQLFSRGVLGAKCKTCLSLAISRIKLVQNKRDVQLKQMRKEIAQFLQTGSEAIARIRVEHVIRDQNIWAAYEILELFCEFVLARVPILESQKECPSELQEAIASIIFAAPRCSDLPELLQIKNLFTTKYGKEFVSAASELRPDTSVNRGIIEKLSVKAPSPETRLKILKEIAEEYNLDWDSSRTEAEFSKKHEDLLEGSNQILSEAADSQMITRQCSVDSTLSNEANPIITRKRNNEAQHPQIPTPPKEDISLIGHDRAERSITNLSEGSFNNIKTETRSHSPDILELARAAIASAERASATARAAAELVNVKGPWMQEGKSV
ncbi:IST1-like protein [Macadamia integrifolia]|uniref:IST1-like protein n=1 Tax=Macadamia integrifolia TaxID=60698 RepID=UPI001C4E9622|nr:IST1-like protein [Macadamia integrifolia]